MNTLFPTAVQSEMGTLHKCFMPKSDLVTVTDPWGYPHIVSRECLSDTLHHKYLVPLRTRKGCKYSDLPQNHISRRRGDCIHRENIRIIQGVPA